MVSSTITVKDVSPVASFINRVPKSGNKKDRQQSFGMKGKHGSVVAKVEKYSTDVEISISFKTGRYPATAHTTINRIDAGNNQNEIREYVTPIITSMWNHVMQASIWGDNDFDNFGNDDRGDEPPPDAPVSPLDRFIWLAREQRQNEFQPSVLAV